MAQKQNLDSPKVAKMNDLPAIGAKIHLFCSQTILSVFGIETIYFAEKQDWKCNKWFAAHIHTCLAIKNK